MNDGIDLLSKPEVCAYLIFTIAITLVRFKAKKGSEIRFSLTIVLVPIVILFLFVSLDIFATGVKGAKIYTIYYHHTTYSDESYNKMTNRHDLFKKPISKSVAYFTKEDCEIESETAENIIFFGKLKHPRYCTPMKVKYSQIFNFIMEEDI